MVKLNQYVEIVKIVENMVANLENAHRVIPAKTISVNLIAIQNVKFVHALAQTPVSTDVQRNVLQTGAKSVPHQGAVQAPVEIVSDAQQAENVAQYVIRISVKIVLKLTENTNVYQPVKNVRHVYKASVKTDVGQVSVKNAKKRRGCRAVHSQPIRAKALAQAVHDALVLVDCRVAVKVLGVTLSIRTAREVI